MKYDRNTILSAVLLLLLAATASLAQEEEAESLFPLVEVWRYNAPQLEATFKVAEILRLDQESDVVLVGMNLYSGRAGSKGIIKVESRMLTPQEVNKIALIAPYATLNIIKDYEVVRKVGLSDG